MLRHPTLTRRVNCYKQNLVSKSLTKYCIYAHTATCDFIIEKLWIIAARKLTKQNHIQKPPLLQSHYRILIPQIQFCSARLAKFTGHCCFKDVIIPFCTVSGGVKVVNIEKVQITCKSEGARI